MSTARLPTPNAETIALPPTLARPIRAVAFWTAIVLSLAYPVLLYGGLGGDELLAFVAATTTHAVALWFGRGYDPAG